MRFEGTVTGKDPSAAAKSNSGVKKRATKTTTFGVSVSYNAFKEGGIRTQEPINGENNLSSIRYVCRFVGGAPIC